MLSLMTPDIIMRRPIRRRAKLALALRIAPGFLNTCNALLTCLCACWRDSAVNVLRQISFTTGIYICSYVW